MTVFKITSLALACALLLAMSACDSGTGSSSVGDGRSGYSKVVKNAETTSDEPTSGSMPSH